MRKPCPCMCRGLLSVLLGGYQASSVPSSVCHLGARIMVHSTTIARADPRREAPCAGIRDDRMAHRHGQAVRERAVCHHILTRGTGDIRQHQTMVRLLDTMCLPLCPAPACGPQSCAFCCWQVFCSQVHQVWIRDAQRRRGDEGGWSAR